MASPADNNQGDRVEPFMTEQKGLGLRAQRGFKAGQTITYGTVLLGHSLYKGSVTADLTARFAQLGPRSSRRRRLADLMRLTGQGDPRKKADLRRFADRYSFADLQSGAGVVFTSSAPATRGCLFSWEISLINHACEPNATLQLSPSHDERYNVVAVRDIAEGEEITISYNYQGKRFNCLCQKCAARKSKYWPCVVL